MKWKRTLFMIPLTFFFSALELIGQADAVPAETILLHSIFGQVTSGDITNLTLTIETMWFLMMFPFFYGNYISKNLNSTGSVYLFSRVVNRKKWVGAMFLKLCLHDFLYTLFFMAVKVQIAICHSTLPFDHVFFKTVCLLFVLIFLWNMEIALLVNLIALKTNSVIGLFFGEVALIVLILLEVSGISAPIMHVWNPVSVVAITENFFGAIFQKMGINILYSMFLMLGLRHKISCYDIFHMEQE